MTEKVEKIIKTLGFKITNKLKDDLRYFVSIGKINNHEVLLKISTSDYTEKQLLTEIIISQKIYNKYKDDFYPAYIRSGKIDGNSYLLRDFIEANALGNVFGFDYKRIQKEDLKKIITTIEKTNILSTDKLPVKNYQWYLEDFHNHKKNWFRLFNELRAEKTLNFFVRNKSLLNNKLVTNHGDVFPHNIIKMEDKIYFIDWGEAVAADKFLDVITVWVNLWQKPAWQKEFIKNLIIDKKSEVIAKFFVYYLSCRTLAIIYSCKKLKDNLPYKNKSGWLIKYHNMVINKIISGKFNF